MPLSDLTIQVYGFPGFRGLNLKDGPLTVPPEFSQRANFLNFGLLGTIEKAKAPGKFNTAQITNNPAVLAMAFYRQIDGDEFFVVYCSNGKMYKLSDVGVLTDITPSTVTIATGKYGHFFSYNNLLWFSDGVNKPIYVHDTVVAAKWFELGITAPAAAPTVADGAAGVLNGSFYYKIVYEGSTGARSNAGPASAQATPTNQQVDLTNIPVYGGSAENVTKRLIYRTLTNGAIDSVYYYVTTINDNTTTTYSDNIADSALGERLFEEKEKPPAGTWGFTEYNGSVYGFVPGTHNLIYSNINEPEAWGAFNIEPILPGDGYPIMGLGKLNNLVIFKRKSIHNWIGVPGLFRRDQKTNGVGCIAPRSIKNVDLPAGGEVLFFLSKHGPRYYDEQDAFLLARELEPIFNGSDPTYKFNQAKAEQSSAEYDEATRRYLLSIPVNSSSENNLLLIYDIYANSWSVRAPLYAGSIVYREKGSDKQDQIMIGESRSDVTNGGWVAILENDDSYYTANFKGEYVTAWNHFNYPNHIKLLRFFEVDAEAEGDFNLMIDIYTDGGLTPVLTFPVSLSETGYLWDAANSLWDIATWSKDIFLTDISTLKKVQGRYISVGFRTESKNQRWKVMSARVQYQLLPNAGDRR